MDKEKLLSSMPMITSIRQWWNRYSRGVDFEHELTRLHQKAPVPVLWLLGKTQSGKTSLIRYLTGADDAEIGRGFRPCTRFSREYQFPTTEAPLLTFLDTRGFDEPSYDVREDLAQFDRRAHLVIVTVKALDHALERLLEHLRTIRSSQSRRPILLALTCLHEAYPQQQHGADAAAFQLNGSADALPAAAARALGAETLEPAMENDTIAARSTDDPAGNSQGAPPDIFRTLAEQRRRFANLVDDTVAIDLTRPEEGFLEPNFGGEILKHKVAAHLPRAYRQSLVMLDQTTGELRDLVARRALPRIAGYSTLAATAGAYPIPWVDLLVLPGIQTRMIYDLARLYGQPLSATRFMELATSLGAGVAFRQAIREVVKLVPVLGSLAGGALAGASTFALGKAFCFYYEAVHQGHVPSTADLKRYYQEELGRASKQWGLLHRGAST
jgi:uncharacterized protein (DUF697 family)